MNKKIIDAITIGSAIVILGVVILSLFLGGEYKKTAYGEEVQCTITQNNTFFGDTLGYYYDKDGSLIEAEFKNVSPSTDNTCKGYIMPDKPGKVYLKSSALLYVGYIALSLFLIVGGIILIIYVISQNANHNLISSEGSFTTGEIVSIRYERAGNDMYYVANIRYVDENGDEHFFEDYSDKNDRRQGEQYTIGYARKKNGKYTAKIM